MRRNSDLESDAHFPYGKGGNGMTIDILDMILETAERYHVNAAVLDSRRECPEYFDLGLRSALLKDEKAALAASNIYHACKEGVLYHILDRFDTEYDVFAFPEGEKQYGDYLVIGPYRNGVMDDYRLNNLVQKLGLPIRMISDLREYFYMVPLIMDRRPWQDLLLFFMYTLYGGKEIEQQQIHLVDDVLSDVRGDGTRDEYLWVKIIEERYRLEGELLDAVAAGDAEQAFRVCRYFSSMSIDRRFKDPNRDRRNLLIISNTIYRKAAERGCVHPFYIDKLSSSFAKRIEAVCTEAQSRSLAREMLRKYCHLVKNHALKGHSLIIQKVVNYICLNLGNDLSLKCLAEEYSVNPSYLSALFKKEMGMTITAFINEQRMKQAVLYLNSTSLRIQTIATEVGFTDLNYFSKVFKKYTGITPSDYRKKL